MRDIRPIFYLLPEGLEELAQVVHLNKKKVLRLIADGDIPVRVGTFGPYKGKTLLCLWDFREIGVRYRAYIEDVPRGHSCSSTRCRK